jgi:Alginate export
MKNLKKLVLTGIAGLIAATSFGQFTLSGEYRPRAEYGHGYKKVADTNQSAGFHISQRARINVGYVVSDYEFFVQLQDIRVWGDAKTLKENPNSLGVHQAWAKANFNKNWGVKLGRQEISYDDQRIFGAVGWAQQARSHDAALLQFKNEKTKLDVGFTFNQDGNNGYISTDYTTDINYRDMQFAHFNTSFGKKVNMSLLAMNIGQQVATINTDGDPHKSMQYFLTAGTHTKFDLGKFKAGFSGYYQMGSDNVLGKSVSAYLVGLDMNYKVAKTFSVGLGYEMQSGNTQTDTTIAYNDINHAFNPKFGTNHKFNGFQDYFYVGNWGKSVGLQDAYLKLKFKKGIWSAGLDVHFFMTGLGTEVLDGVSYNTAYNDLVTAGDQAGADALDMYSYTLPSSLGTEIDFSLGTKINKSVTVKAGYSHMLASETLATLNGVLETSGPDAGRGRTDQINNWGYVMIIFKPTFLKK